MLLLLLLLQIHSTTGIVYTVVSDDDDSNITCYHCHNLQHYLLNTSKYFTSNTQLLFLPGLHHLHTDLIIQNVHNISLIGNTDTKSLGAVIQYYQYVISVAKCSRVTVANLAFESNDLSLISTYFLKIFCCHHMHLSHLSSENNAINATNVYGNSTIFDIDNTVLHITYEEGITVKPNGHFIDIQNYQATKSVHFQTTIEINLLDISYSVTINIANSEFIY